jgi:dTDP-4-amino-4,6-dideoxygalactose transaminase
MITKKPVDKYNLLKKHFYTNSARESWEILLDYLKSNGDNIILLPSYIGVTDREGSGIFDPIKKTNTKFMFYELDDDLTPKLDNVKKLLSENNNIGGILLVHYFGFRVSNYIDIVEYCKSENIKVIEDCAHYFNMDFLGDFSIYSLHKILPFDKGGLLVNNTDIEICNNKFSLEFDYSALIDNYDLNKIRDIRRSNYRKYLKLLNNVDGVKVLKNMGDSDIPQTFPIIVENDKREILYFKLHEEDIPTIALYYRLIPEISNDFINSYEISNNILNLPLHQDITEDDIILITNSIKKILKTI